MSQEELAEWLDWFLSDTRSAGAGDMADSAAGEPQLCSAAPSEACGPDRPEPAEPEAAAIRSGEEPRPCEEEPLGPNDVACDSCIESPRRALKSCLTCLVSYCEAHLRPHLEKPKFQNHRLVEPLRDIERRTCESHKWPLEMFCLTDSRCICQDCVTEDHGGHSTRPVVEARRQIEASSGAPNVM